MTSNTGSLLQSIQILVTGVAEKEKRRLHDIAKSQGAVILTTANANDPPHVVITRTVGSPRYFTIIKRNANIPIVTPEWLTSSIEKGTRLPYTEFAAGIFQGLVICFSGLSVPEKKEFSKHVESQGGRHSPVLDRSCTHLVTDSTQSDKFVYAQHNSMYCVTPAWIEESLSSGRCLDPGKYLITKPVSQQQQQQSLLAKQASLQRGKNLTSASGLSGDLTDNTDTNNFNINTSNQHLKPDASVRSESEEPMQRKVAVDTTLPRGAGLESSRPGSRLGNPTAAVAVGGGDIDLAISATPVGAAPWTTLDHEDDAPLFLDSCFIWVTCCTPAEEQESLILCAQGGAKRFLEPHPTLTTHVILGSSVVPGQAEAVQSFTSEHRDVPVVGLEWLRRSVARREVLVPDERFTVTVPSTMMMNKSTGAALLGNGGAGGGSISLLGFNDSNSLPVFNNTNIYTNNNNTNGGIGVGEKTGGGGGGGVLLLNGGDADGADASGSGSAFLLNRQNSGASLLGGFLDNCYFTLAAVRGTSEGDAAERLIRMHGGRIFSTSVPTSVKACFAICPYSLPSHKVHALRMAHPDFAAVNEAQRFTLWWLECCVQAGEVLPCQAGTACFQPLPFSLPLKDMDKVSVSISGYEPSVRAAIQRTVEIVGGRVSLEYMTAKDTHLIVPVAHGKKYKYAARYGVIPVTAAWLLESVKAGKALPPDNFAPLLPSGGIPPTVSNDAGDTSQLNNLPSSSFLLHDKPPIATQNIAGVGKNGGQSLYAAAIAGPAALNQASIGAGASKPSLKQKAQRLRDAAKRTAPGSNVNMTSTATAQPLGTKKTAATAFDFDSLMGPLQKNKSAGGGNTTNIVSAALASLVGVGTGAPPAIQQQQQQLPGNTIPIHTETEGAAELDAAVNHFSSILDRMKGRGNGTGHSSQHDMPPPPARGGNGGFNGGPQEESGDVSVEKPGRNKRSKAGEDSGPAVQMMPPRRSSRRGGERVNSGISELMESEGVEMSQQVGYESAAVEVVEVAVGSKEGMNHAAARAAAVAKERLTRAATRNRRGQTNTRDILDGF